MGETVLETQGLTMRFGGVIAANNVDFKLQARELRCLIGPNGAGKSTFFKCISGLQTPTEGQVYMRGQETTRWMPHEIASLGVGIKTQTPNVMDALSVFENIWLAARRFHAPSDAERKTQEIIERLALGSIARKDLGQLAHGERQRVELGLVAVGDPWLVLLDEPAAGMSAEDVARMTEIIHELNKTAAVVIVEHDMQFIRSIAEKVTVFHQGAVLMEDHVDRVLSDPTVRNVYLGKKA
ncbi:MAG: ABC transporter ATP-binding protein [Roseobacter sp. MedPE-SWde]|uniref:ATP-binding cassette domain-containing protein n=1 Tax=Roseobacter sp. MED193 TaxID=314262 RepID=UPI000068B6D4|nr:ATP-binding cassette domain-containing protein [Roseobacter sp. MED193]EAQ47495.1 ABC-type transport system ATP-binding protein II [Roseobacter sp. MED193]OIQ42129.1 MAG: ABC transporter ATP-binding protein [Roseobacter sp. MedPE-SWde]